ncbi:glycoside hydrolase [Chaetomidium leptoderma]|uniref:Mannan endo-1,6-alpha-mannosidase n=1 Tax=Chaetomidium leptoderma TaxID=669021 RepID=A0AAN6VKD8_9PEZI|nr:glycoside hydrolase [Chaetomidium leptoderma]
MYTAALPLLLAGAGLVSAALEVDFGSTASIKSAAKDVAFDLMLYYKGNQTGEIPGILGSPPPSGQYYWWTGAVLWSTMLDYWRYTGDETYNTVALEGLVHQNGPDLQHPFMPPNWTASMGNDDHGFWGLSAMSAAELEFPNAPGGEPSWIELAQRVFGALEARYDMTQNTCDGGLRWQVPPTNNGYNIKNTLSNAVFLNLGARLARYTGNQTYAEWADKTWDWLSTVGLIKKYSNFISIHDSISVENCTDINEVRWSVNTGVLLEGAAYMYNQTTGDEQATWRTRIQNITVADLASSFPFTRSDQRILVEYNCETGFHQTCNPGIHFYKGIYLRALANTAQLAPFTRDDIARRFRDSAEAAVQVCNGGPSGRACAYKWNMDANWEKRAVNNDEGPGGAPEEMNALSVLLGLLVDEPASKGFATNATVTQGEAGKGGGDGGAGNGDGSQGNGTGNGGSAGTTTRVAVGWMVGGLVAALL